MSEETFPRFLFPERPMLRPPGHLSNPRITELGVSDERSRRLYYRGSTTSNSPLQGSNPARVQTTSAAKPKRQAPTALPSKSVRPTGGRSSVLPSSDDMPFNVSQEVDASLLGDSDGDLDDEYIRCICGIPEEDPIHAMICCDGCTAWQHNICMGLSEVEEELPPKYYCEMCRPYNHKKTLRALERGELIWQTRLEETWESKVITAFRNKIQA